jgi:hypothetical protein
MLYPEHVKLGIEVPLEDLAKVDSNKLAMSSHTNIARDTRRIAAGILSVVDLQNMWLMEQLTFAYVSLVKSMGGVIETLKEDEADLVIWISMKLEAGIDACSFGHQEMISGESALKARVAAFKALKEFDQVSRKYREHFEGAENKVAEHLKLIEQLNNFKLSNRAYLLKKSKSQNIRDKSSYILRAIYFLCKCSEKAALSELEEFDLTSADPLSIDRVLCELEREDLLTAHTNP